MTFPAFEWPPEANHQHNAAATEAAITLSQTAWGPPPHLKGGTTVLAGSDQPTAVQIMKQYGIGLDNKQLELLRSMLRRGEDPSRLFKPLSTSPSVVG